MNDIRNIRLYGREWTPDFFNTLSKTLRTRWMLFLNGLRWRLEIRVQWHAEYLIKANGAEHADVLRTEWQKDLDPPTRVIRAYGYGANVPVASAPGVRMVEDPTIQTQKLMARLVAHPRSQRYARSRNTHVFHDLEPSDGETNAENTETAS